LTVIPQLSCRPRTEAMGIVPEPPSNLYESVGLSITQKKRAPVRLHGHCNLAWWAGG